MNLRVVAFLIAEWRGRQRSRPSSGQGLGFAPGDARTTTMHEVGIIQNALSQAAKQAQARGATQIHKLKLRVGAMTGVVPDALHFAFETVRQGTMASTAQLEIEEVPLTCWCVPCQREFQSADRFEECPSCHTISNEIRRGLELELVTLDIS